MSIEENYDLISLDIVSSFTNIPVNLAMDSVSNRWSHLNKGTKIPKSEFLKALKLILESTYTTRDNYCRKLKMRVIKIGLTRISSQPYKIDLHYMTFVYH